jgi:hypothetical protein
MIFNRFFLSAILVGTFLSQAAFSSQQQLNDFEKWLRYRFEWSGNIKLIETSDCKIKLEKSPYNSVGFFIYKGGGQSTFTPSYFMQDLPGISLKMNSQQLQLRQQRQDCEEQGCAGPFYTSDAIDIGPHTLRFMHAEAYSHTPKTVTCTIP